MAAVENLIGIQLMGQYYLDDIKAEAEQHVQKAIEEDIKGDMKTVPMGA